MPRARVSLMMLSLSAFSAAVGGRVAVGGAESPASSEQAVELAKKTGRPILAIAGSET
ncbi:MAG TPA: hypothetical protein VFI31_01615 [Pirellulales bacterium]|nr:hypothetical protein [Pirellulales bacterium]